MARTRMRRPSHPRPAAAPGDAAPARRWLGQGRSGQVFEEVASGGRLACKVFLPDRASSLVNTLLTGAVNPYRWNRDAVESAVLRRRILEPLVAWWFDGRVRLPVTHGMRWVEGARAFELRAELIEGRHAMLRHPDAGDAQGESRELRTQVLAPLQRHLADAGFDGLLWQAGRGNPVAAANFMRELRDGATARWVWIDAESGVPALFSLNPWHLLTTYLPLSVKHRRWLFDDVDMARLGRYVESHAADLAAHLGARALDVLRRDVEALAASQDRWRALGRTRRSVASHASAGRITPEQARHYETRPVRWLARLALRACARVPGTLLRACARVLPRLSPRVAVAALGRWGRFFLSTDVRERWASRTVRRRVVDWRERGFLAREDAQALRRAMAGSDDAAYIADFGVHLAIKPAVKLLVWVLVPLLQLFGAIDSWWLVGALAFYGGAIGRTLYTLGRSLQSLVRGRPVPWAALVAGLLPVAGNAAYPLQLLAATGGHDGRVARFLMHDIFSALGRRVPIWGGKDTLFEHRFNALARLVTRA